jgi:hypothetical protein
MKKGPQMNTDKHGFYVLFELMVAISFRLAMMFRFSKTICVHLCSSVDSFFDMSDANSKQVVTITVNARELMADG